MKPVTFLLFDAHGHGDLARAVIGVANALVADRPVAVISLWRRAEDLHYPLDPRVEFEVLLDRQSGLTEKQQVRAEKRTKLRPLPVEKKHAMNRATDKALAKRLAGFKGVLVSTRPSLHLAAISCVPPRARVVGWEHQHFDARWENPRMRDVLRAVVPNLAEYVVPSDDDAEGYRRDLGALAPPIQVIAANGPDAAAQWHQVVERVARR